MRRTLLMRLRAIPWIRIVMAAEAAAGLMIAGSRCSGPAREWVVSAIQSVGH
jgi:hypothetical protein